MIYLNDYYKRELEMRKNIQHQLKRARIHRRLTQRKLGEKLGVLQGAISRLETNHQEVTFTISSLYKVCSALDYDVEIKLIPRERSNA